MKSRHILIPLMILILVLAACGGGGDDDNDSGDDNNDSNSNAQQSTPSDSGSASEGRSPAAAVQEVNVEIEGGSLKVGSPAGWLGNTTDGIIFANSQEALDLADVTGLTTGQIRGMVDFIPKDSPTLETIGIRNSTVPQLAIGPSVEALEDGAGEFTLENPLPFIISGRTAAIAYGTAVFGDTTLDAAVLIISKPNGFGRLFFYAPQGEIRQYDGALRNIAGAIEYTAS